MSGQASASGTTGRKGGEISVFDKGRIVGWHDEGISKTKTGHNSSFLKAVDLYFFYLLSLG